MYASQPNSYIAGGNVKWYNCFGKLYRKSNIHVTYPITLSLLHIEEEKWDQRSSKKDLYKNIYSAFIYNSPNLERAQVFIHRRRDKLWYITIEY